MPGCLVPSNPLFGAPKDPHPAPLPSAGRPLDLSSLADIDDDVGSSACVVKALVVLEGSRIPFPMGLMAVTAPVGVASLLIV
jgi:hypothetical protein